VQGKSSLIEDRDGGPRAVDADEIDIQQAFGEFSFRFNNDRDRAMIRAGRQDLIYGAQRLIGVSDWTNVRRTFDGVRGSIGLGNQTIDAFWVRPVVVNKERMNSSDDNSNFVGIYDVISLPDFMREARTKLDAYFLWLNHDNTAPLSDSDTFTLGAHFFTNPKPWDLDVEADWQFGNAAEGGDINAWSIAIEGGYTLSGVTWTPRLLLGFDAASGDDDPTDGDHKTFNQLFPSGHPYFGYIDAIAGRTSSMCMAASTLHLHPPDCFAGTIFLLARKQPRRPLQRTRRTPDRRRPGSSKYIGSEFDALLTWVFDRHWSAYAGYSHFFAGDFVEEAGSGTGADSDIDFVYGSITFTF